MTSCRKKGGNMLNGISTASSNVIVPFGLLYAQKRLQKSKRIEHINDLYKKQTKKYHKKSYKKRKYKK
jgi:hypothetical protein